MPSQLLSAQLKIQSAGSPLEPWLARALVSWEVQDNRTAPDSFLLRFSDPTYAVLDHPALAIGGPVDLAVQVAGSGAPRPLLAGEITAVELDYAEQRCFAIVRGLDVAHRLYRGRRTESYEGQRIPEIIDKVAKRAGLTVADAGDIPAGGNREVVNQTAESDAGFLDRLTRHIGAQWWVVRRQLHVRALPPPQGAPAGSTPPQSSGLVLDPAHGLVSLLASASSAGQVTEVQVPGWDPVRKEPVLGRAPVQQPSVEVDGLTPAGMAGSFAGQSPPLVYAGMVASTQEEADAAAQSIAAQVASGCVELDGTAIGNPDLRAGAAVTIGATVRPFAGRYVLTSTRHYQHQHGGYRTDFIASGWSDRSLSGMIAGTTGPGAPAANLMVGVVRNVDDPDGHGRVRVNLPGIGESNKTGWLPVVYPGAGNGAGLVAPLAVGAQALVAVPASNPDAAMVLGGLHNQQDPPPVLPQGVEFHDANTGEVQGVCLTAPGGAQLAIVHTASVRLVRLATADANHTIEIDQANNVITIRSRGRVVLAGDQGISIEASGGPVEIKGTAVTIDAGGGTVAVKGSSVQIG